MKINKFFKLISTSVLLCGISAPSIAQNTTQSFNGVEIRKRNFNIIVPAGGERKVRSSCFVGEFPIGGFIDQRELVKANGEVDFTIIETRIVNRTFEVFIANADETQEVSGNIFVSVICLPAHFDFIEQADEL